MDPRAGHTGALRATDGYRRLRAQMRRERLSIRTSRPACAVGQASEPRVRGSGAEATNGIRRRSEAAGAHTRAGARRGSCSRARGAAPSGATSPATSAHTRSACGARDVTPVAPAIASASTNSRIRNGRGADTPPKDNSETSHRRGGRRHVDPHDLRARDLIVQAALLGAEDRQRVGQRREASRDRDPADRDR